VLAWLSVCSEVQTCIQPIWCHCHSLSLACLSKIQIGFTFLVPAHLGSLGKRLLNGGVCVLGHTSENWEGIFVQHRNSALNMMLAIAAAQKPGDINQYRTPALLPILLCSGAGGRYGSKGGCYWWDRQTPNRYIHPALHSMWGLQAASKMTCTVYQHNS